MRTSIALVIAAATAVIAKDCNPTYNTPGSGECFTNCNIQAGKVFYPDWTMDHTSDKFLDSLKLMCTKGTSQYTAFMTKAGMCMMGCTDPQELFNNEFAGACAWYAEHKDDKCAEEGSASGNTSANAAATSASAPATTGASSANAESAASKLQMSGVAMALVAGAGYLAL
ncbi:hypothetical protein BD770DRAFT_410702 [Pilaira anomala]|nr:hypothetical protein BD770DRAFT_410702 [Pilaira anomala]